MRCQDPLVDHGFCEFHLQAFLRGEIDARGWIAERLDDQERRRAINYHAIAFPEERYPG